MTVNLSMCIATHTRTHTPFHTHTLTANTHPCGYWIFACIVQLEMKWVTLCFPKQKLIQQHQQQAATSLFVSISMTSAHATLHSQSLLLSLYVTSLLWRFANRKVSPAASGGPQIMSMAFNINSACIFIWPIWHYGPTLTCVPFIIQWTPPKGGKCCGVQQEKRNYSIPCDHFCRTLIFITQTLNNK